MCVLTKPQIEERRGVSPPVVNRRADAAPLAWVRWVILLLLAAAIFFNHGCHGDEDNELSAAGWWLSW